ncbi:MAG: hypothetical protein KAJ31_09045 [Deltaproteobacteria bacterium]|nr:hypothetical protein [Deltaproteobacteria bacterium]
MRNSIWTKNVIVALLILAIPLLLVKFSVAEEGNEDNPILVSKLSIGTPDDSLIEQFMETNDFSADTKIYSEDNETAFVYTNSEELEIKAEKLKKEDILSAVPSISTEDNKTLGLLIPPFAYFAKKF